MHDAPNIVLIGPMGAGKSSLGRRLAERFDLQFVDLDAHIEKDTGVSIPMIFEQEGEQGFRDREQLSLSRALEGEGRLIATGGGVVLREANRLRIRERGFAILLRISVDEQLRRLARDRKRPLLQVPDREQRLKELADQREPLYREVADVVFEADSRSVPESLQRLIPLIRARWVPQGAMG